MGNFNIDLTKEGLSGFDKLEDFYDIFNLVNLIQSATCYTNNHKLTTSLFFTKKSFSFQVIYTTDFGLIYCHKLILTSMRFCFSGLKLKLFFLKQILMRQSFYLIWKIQIFLLRLVIQLKIIYFSQIHFPK